MKSITNLSLGVRREGRKGQTMTGYVLIIAAIAIAGQGLEGGINSPT